MPADREPDLTFAKALYELMATHELSNAQMAEYCQCSVFPIWGALRGISTGIKVTTAVIEAFNLWDDSPMLRRILIGYLLQKFPKDWLVIAGLIE